MDKIKYSLIEAVGDLSESELNVKQNVLRTTNQKRRFKLPRFVPISIAFCLALVIAFFALKEMPTNYSTPTNATFNEALFDNLLELYQDVYPDAETNALEVYIDNLAILSYGQYKGFYINEDEVTTVTDHYIENAQSGNVFTLPQLEGVDLSRFQQHYLPHLISVNLVQQELVELYKLDYPSMYDSTLAEMVRVDAIDYFKATSLDELLKNPKIAHIQLDLGRNNFGFDAIIAAEREDAFLLVVSGNAFQIEGLSAEQIVSTFKNLFWMPKMDTSLKVGDFIWVTNNMSHGSDTEIHQIVPTLIKNFENTISLSEDKQATMKALLERLTWTESTVPLEKEKPHYSLYLQDADASYSFNYDVAHNVFKFNSIRNNKSSLVEGDTATEILELFRTIE